MRVLADKKKDHTDVDSNSGFECDQFIELGVFNGLLVHEIIFNLPECEI